MEGFRSLEGVIWWGLWNTGLFPSLFIPGHEVNRLPLPYASSMKSYPTQVQSHRASGSWTEPVSQRKPFLFLSGFISGIC